MKSRPSSVCITTTAAKVMASMKRPRTAMAPNWPSSLRSKITTEITFVFGVKRMIDAESSRITPMKTKHHVAMTPLRARSEEHTSELQSRPHLVCRLLLEKKKNKTHNLHHLTQS